jgi:hypothetical protein
MLSAIVTNKRMEVLTTQRFGSYAIASLKGFNAELQITK